jgi:hypothetical protein
LSSWGPMGSLSEGGMPDGVMLDAMVRVLRGKRRRFMLLQHPRDAGVGVSGHAM